MRVAIFGLGQFSARVYYLAMATRRHFCQAVAVLPVVGFLPSVASELVKVEFVIVPSKEGVLAPFFQQACEDWLLRDPGYRPVGDMLFDPRGWDHEPWLFHPSWDRGLLTEGDSTHLFTPVGTIFMTRRWDIIDRAVDLRLHQYWRAENPPLPYEAMTEGDFRQRLLANRAWRQEQRQRLGYVVVRFDAELIPGSPRV